MRIKTIVLLIILISALIRGLIAGVLQFGNDEVYYWTYAMFPALSHFDHPPMLGWIIQLFTLNLTFDSELFLRLGPIVLGMGSTWLIYLITKTLKNHRAGLFAVLLFSSSIYCFIIAGTFILPDAPQTFFWLLSVYFLIHVVTKQHEIDHQKKYLIYAGIAIGLAILSKYTSVFLWGGFGLYSIFCERKWLKTRTLYLSIFISIILSLPILIWNFQNDFVSFTFHGDRISTSQTMLRFDYFFKEIIGQVLYNNPVVFVLILISLIAVIRRRINIQTEYQHLLLFLSIPLILTFIGISFFKPTLPHWTGPAYMTLLIFPAVYLMQKFLLKKFQWPIIVSLALLFSVLIIGLGQINYGIFPLDHSIEKNKTGKTDFSLSMYGWDQVKEEFEVLISNDKTDAKDAIIVQRWFPAAHLDYYVAKPLGIKLLAIGKLDQIHKYAWINKKRGGVKLGMSGYYITMSNDFNHPEKSYNDIFNKIELVKEIPIIRNEKIVKYAFVYRLEKLIKNPI
ncbi:MAG: phospholipid carrier-dependent glycosyltransferase [Bacteroidetes bacterium]|nr:phospholipid carrier-dependent glycosyltransferase [Bacteroidota bacterium]